jgi:hypothetical protein
LLRRIADGYTTLAEVYRYVLDLTHIERDLERVKAKLVSPRDALVLSSFDQQPGRPSRILLRTLRQCFRTTCSWPRVTIYRARCRRTLWTPRSAQGHCTILEAGQGSADPAIDTRMQ